MSINNFPMLRALEAGQYIGKARRRSFQRELDVARLEDILQHAVLLISQIRLPDQLQTAPEDGKGGEVEDEKSGEADDEPVEDNEGEGAEDNGDADADADGGNGEVSEKGNADGNDADGNGAGGSEPNDEDSDSDSNNDPSTYPPLVPTSKHDPQVGPAWLELDGAVLMFRCSKSRTLEPWYKFVRKADGTRIKECTDHPGKQNVYSNSHYPFPPKTYTHGEPQAKPSAKSKATTKPAVKAKGGAETKTSASANASKKKKK